MFTYCLKAVIVFSQFSAAPESKYKTMTIIRQKYVKSETKS